MYTEIGFVEVGSAKLYSEVAGEGQSLVFIHAGVADSRQWDNEFLHFSRDFRVLRYDMRGYGKSVPVDGEFSHMKDLIAVLDHHAFNQSLVLVGCSMGGTLAMDFALEHPERVKGLVMVGSGPSGLNLEVPDHPKMAEAEDAYESGDWDRLAELEAQIWFDGMGRSAQQVDQEMRALALEMNRLALAHDAKGLGKRMPDSDVPAAERLEELQIPVLVIVGENDIPYLQAAADIMVEHIASVQKHTLEDAAHLSNMEMPEPFQRIVRSFLEEIS
jgi:pimeloyl-ACP methyl ester carboxylesterase